MDEDSADSLELLDTLHHSLKWEKWALYPIMVGMLVLFLSEFLEDPELDSGTALQQENVKGSVISAGEKVLEYTGRQTYSLILTLSIVPHAPLCVKCF
jgi:hypothetical protein